MLKRKNILFIQPQLLYWENKKNLKKLRTPYHVTKYIITGRIQKVDNNEKDELEIKHYPKKKIKQRVENPKLHVECPSCKKRNWVEFDKV